MTRRILAITLLLALLAVAGCRAPAAGPDDLRPVEYTIIRGTPEGELGHWLEALRPVEGVHLRRHGGDSLILVAMGKAPTGYEVVLDKVTDQGNHALLEVTCRAPKTHGGVADSYPYLLVAVKTDKEIVVELLDIRSVRAPRRIHEYEAAKFSDLIVLRSPVPFQSVGESIRLAGRVRTELPVYARVEDVETTLLEATRLELTAAGDGWWEFDQEFELQPATIDFGTVEIWFGTGQGDQSSLLPLRLRHLRPKAPSDPT